MAGLPAHQRVPAVRGEVLLLSAPGDPLTPGVGATANAKRLTRAQAITILKIPALPLADATLARPAGHLMVNAIRWGISAPNA